MITRSLENFEGSGYNKGRNVIWQIAWHFISHVFFQPFWMPMRFRPWILRLFGAEIGIGCRIRSRVKIHWPWKLSVGDHVWVGEGAWLLNLEEIKIGNSVCISQEAILCTGSHLVNSASFEFDNQAIEIEDGVWVCARAFIPRGSKIAENLVIPANSYYTPQAKPKIRGKEVHD